MTFILSSLRAKRGNPDFSAVISGLPRRLSTFRNNSSPRGFRAHEIGGIVVMVNEHQMEFQEAWHEYFG